MDALEQALRWSSPSCARIPAPACCSAKE